VAQLATATSAGHSALHNEPAATPPAAEAAAEQSERKDPHALVMRHLIQQDVMAVPFHNEPAATAAAAADG
jgi:hypothetical protein